MDAESYSLQFTTETGITGAQSAPAGPGEGPRWTLVETVFSLGRLKYIPKLKTSFFFVVFP